MGFPGIPSEIPGGSWGPHAPSPGRQPLGGPLGHGSTLPTEVLPARAQPSRPAFSAVPDPRAGIPLPAFREKTSSRFPALGSRIPSGQPVLVGVPSLEATAERPGVLGSSLSLQNAGLFGLSLWDWSRLAVAR